MISLKPTTSEREEWMILAELKFKSATTTDKILDIPTDYYCEGQSNYHLPTGYDMQKNASILKSKRKSQPNDIQIMNYAQRVTYKIIRGHFENEASN